MKILLSTVVKKGELGLLYQQGELIKVLEAGEHKFFGFPEKNVDVFPIANTELHQDFGARLHVFYKEIAEQYTLTIETAKEEIALYYVDGILQRVFLPDNKATYWKSYLPQEIKKITLKHGYELPESIAKELLTALKEKRKITGLEAFSLQQIGQGQIGTLTVDGDLAEFVFNAGYRGYLQGAHTIQFSFYNADAYNLITDEISQKIFTFFPEIISQHCHLIEMNENSVGLRYQDARLVEIIPPKSRKLYWQNSHQFSVTHLDIDESNQIPKEIIKELINPELRQDTLMGSEYMIVEEIPAYHVGMLSINGEIEQLRPAGTIGYWRFNQKLSLKIVDTRLQTLEVSGQEILTKDKVNLRVTLIANWRFSDILASFNKIADPENYFYRELQLSLREAIGTRTLDELLENKELINRVVLESSQANLLAQGIHLESVGVKDIILPGEMKEILAQVVEAEKSAQANVIRRREETAATRSLLNTAKVMENNPVALRLKEMETLEKIAEKIESIKVVGGLDQVLNGLVNIKNIQHGD